MVKHLGHCLDANLSGESMAMKSTYRQNEFLNPESHKL